VAQLILGAAGAVIGSFVPGVGTALGWSIGSAVGGLVAGGGQKTQRQHVEGAKLEDLRVTGTEYSQCIPYVVGSPRIAGQLWRASEKRQIANTSTTVSGGGGKGGGGTPEVITTTTIYTYDVDLLLGLTDNQVESLLRVWENGKLIWTVAQPNSNRWSSIALYVGNTTQLPDPTYEAAVGTANAVAYRGRAYVFIQSLHLGQSGQIPNLTFELGATV